MSLVVFRSRAAGEIYMFSENANRIFAILGRPEAERGVITAEQVPDALQRLSAAVELEKTEARAAQKGSAATDRSGGETSSGQAISLAQRAFPLLEMLRAAQKRHVDVTWGV